MTKQTKLAIIATSILLVLFGVCIYASQTKANDSDSKEIANLEYRMNELRKQKEKCYDDLSYEDSWKARDGFIKPCVQWDEEIMSLREKADALKAKWYEGLN